MTDNKVAVKVESSKEIVEHKNIDIKGLEDLPTSMIPVPFYKLVQPGSTGVTMSNGKDAQPGQIFMKDAGTATDQLRFALLRAKRIKREFTDKNGELMVSPTIGLLGINLENFTPFILGVSLASFAGVGQLVKQLKDKKAEAAWEYPIIATSQKREEKKNTDRGEQMVKYYVLNFIVEENKLDKESLKTVENAFSEFSGALDRNNEEVPPVVENDHQGENKEDIPF